MKKALTVWSKETFDDVFKEINMLEEIIELAEETFERKLNGRTREKLHKT